MGNHRKSYRKTDGGNARDKGNTMVEVMVSLFALGMLAAVFSNIFFFSGRAARRVEERLAAENRLIEQYYLGEGVLREKIGEGTFTFYPVGQDGGAEDGVFFRLTDMEIYRYTDESGSPEAVYDVIPGR